MHLLLLTWIGSVAAGLLWFFIAFHSIAANAAGPVANMAMVRTSVFVRDRWDFSFQYHGTVKPQSQVILLAEVEGRIAKIHPRIQAGQPVPAGETLFVIDSPALEARLIAARAKVQQARQSLLQAQAKIESAGEVPGLKTPVAYRQQMLETQKALFETAQQELDLAQSSVARREISVGFMAQVTLSDFSVGQLVTPGTQLGQAYAPDKVYVEFGVGHQDLRYFEQQSLDQVNVVVAQPNGPGFDYFEGELLGRNGVIDPVSGLETFRVGVEDHSGLRPGARVPVRLQVASNESLFRVPLSFTGRSYLFGVKTLDQQELQRHDLRPLAGFNIGQAVRLNLFPVFRDHLYEYFKAPQPSIRLIQQPPSWLLPGHLVQFKNDHSFESQGLSTTGSGF